MCHVITDRSFGWSALCRLRELQTERSRTAERRSEVQERLLVASRRRDTCAARAPSLDAAYRRAQAARGFLTDLIECLDEKVGTGTGVGSGRDRSTPLRD